jgi:hypothetical protein
MGVGSLGNTKSGAELASPAKLRGVGCACAQMMKKCATINNARARGLITEFLMNASMVLFAC